MDAQVTRTTLAVDGDTYRRLVELARENERSASAEARVAIRKHLEASAAYTGGGRNKLVGSVTDGNGAIG
jgi:predicted transcriptional regulator